LRSMVFRVVPRLPERLESLRRIAGNAWWTWNRNAVSLFRSVDQDLWESCGHNPILLLGRASQSRMAELAEDTVFLSRMDEVESDLENYMSRSTWFDKAHEGVLQGSDVVAYFSAEFGLHESLPIYSGGLGVLAGDTIKSASDLGIPFVGITLLYRLGYFSQYLNSDGWQQESYPVNDYSNMPVERVRNANGEPVVISVPMADRAVSAAVWRLPVGKASLLLLDTNLPENPADDRLITDQLYGGDKEMQIRQEILLGIGWIKALRAVGLNPAVRHINEGHSAFLVMEMLAEEISRGLVFAEAVEAVRAGNVFTTHTPVPAGNEEFEAGLVLRYMRPYMNSIGIKDADFLELGRHPQGTSFSMTVFALNFSHGANGVSELHGRVSRNIWKGVWPNLPHEDIPIGHVTNGVHENSWVSGEMRRLLDRYVGDTGARNPLGEKFWRHIDRIPDSELWRAHERLRERMVAHARQHWTRQLASMGLTLPAKKKKHVLNPEFLTIGFARRFSTYKRAALLLQDEPRLLDLLTDPERPIQIIFSGKAHPHDQGGKDLIRRIFHTCMKREFYGRMVYLDDYSMNLARTMVQGVDVWLNTPGMNMEASGTSGMKACMNGVLHCSIPDGWWHEGYRRDAGWSIGMGELYDDPAQQDAVEAKTLFDLIENSVIPAFYNTGADSIPRSWTAMMKKTMKGVLARFNTNRMLTEYLEGFYLPALSHSRALSAEDSRGCRALAAWKNQVRSVWKDILITDVTADAGADTFTVGDCIPVTVSVFTGGLSPDDLAVEIQHGNAGGDGFITERSTTRLSPSGGGDGHSLYVGELPCRDSGRFGFTVRVLPSHPVYGRIIEPGLVKWWE